MLCLSRTFCFYMQVIERNLRPKTGHQACMIGFKVGNRVVIVLTHCKKINGGFLISSPFSFFNVGKIYTMDCVSHQKM